MTVAMELTAAKMRLPSSPAVLATAQIPQNAPLHLVETSHHKGKIFSKDAPLLIPITPITPNPNDEETINLIAVIAAMMTAVQEMEILISALMSKLTSLESTMQSSAAKANAYCEAKAIEKQAKAEEAAKKAAKLGDIMKIVGYIASAVVCIATLGTGSFAVAGIIAALTVAEATGGLQRGVDEIVKGILIVLADCKAISNADPEHNSALTALLNGLVKLFIIVIATAGTGAVAGGSEAAAEDGTADATAASVDAGADAGVDASAEVDEAAQEANVAEEASASNSDKTSEEAQAAKNAKISMAKKMAFSNTFGNLNPFGDLGVAIARCAKHNNKDDAIEGWINMSTAIISSIIGMAAMFSAAQSAANSGTMLGKLLDDPVAIAKVTNTLSQLTLALNLASSGMKIAIGVIKIDQGEDEKELGKLQGVSTEIKSVNELLQTLAQDQQKWMQQNTKLDKQLSDSFEYDEFANFAQVQLHG